MPLRNRNRNTIPNFRKVGGAGFTGLLDDYGGAAAAYSVRRLSSTYEGALIRVREDGGDTEADIRFDSNGDLDTTALLSHCGSNNGFVVTWYDQSGNNNNKIQPTESQQPKVFDSITGIVVENEIPALYFDGLNDGLLINKNFSLQNISTFFTFSANNNQDAVLFQISENINNIFSFGLGNIGFENAYGSRLIVSGVSYTTGKTNVGGQKLASHFAQKTNPNIDLFLNNIIATGSQSARSGSGAQNTVGFRSDGLFATNSKIQEFIIYQSNQLSNRSNIELNINSYFNIYL